MKYLEKMRDELKEIQKRERRLIRNPKVKALLVIDMLLINVDCGDDKLLSTIYKIAHSASGICGNPHEDWKQKTQTLYRRLKREEK